MPRPKKYLSENPQAVTVGTTKFRPVTSKEKQLITKNKRFWINEREWPIDYGKFDKFKWKQTFEIIEQASIQNLWLNDNKSTQVLKSLAPCFFKNLLILNLNANQIINLEAVSLLQAPNLQRIQFNDNQLTDIKSFRKIHFQNLNWVSFCNNPIVDFSVLTQLFAPYLQRLDFKRKPFPILDESVNWLLKIQSNELRRVDAVTFRRIEQHEVKSMINRRFLEIAMQWTVIA